MRLLRMLVISDAQHDAADDVGVDRAGELHAPAGPGADALADLGDGAVLERDRARHLDGQQAVVLLPETIELPAHAEDDRHAVVLDQELEEVGEERVGVAEHPGEAVALFLGREVGGEEEELQIARGVDCVGHLGELVAHLIEAARVEGRFEQCARVDGGDLFHRCG